MNGVRTGHVVLGGLAAGLIINVGESVLNLVLLGDQMNAAMARMNLPPATGAAAITTWIALGFALGFAMTWLYAAIRPRYGAGPATAVRAALAVYFFAYLYPSIGMAVMGMFPLRLVVIGLAWGVAEILIAGIAGAWVYTETPLPGEARI
jgi:hypothetical protein